MFCGGSATAIRLRKGDETQPDRLNHHQLKGEMSVTEIRQYRDNLIDKGYRRMTRSGFKGDQGWMATNKKRYNHLKRQECHRGWSDIWVPNRLFCSSIPLRIRRKLSGLRISACIISASRFLSIRPRTGRLTISLDRRPHSASCLDTFRPINPVAPVTKPGLLKGFQSAHAAIKVKNLTGQPGTVIRQQI